MRCLISPSGERSQGMSSATTTLGRVAYSLRNSADFRISSARQLQVLLPDRACFLSSIALMRCCSCRLLKSRRRIGLVVRRALGRPFHHLLQQQMHEQEQRLCLEHEVDAFLGLGVVEVLMHAAVLDQHHVAGLPFDPPPVVHVVAVPLEHVEHRAVEMAVLLAAGLGRVSLDMGLDRLDDGGGLRADDALAVHLRPTLPGHVGGGIDPRLIHQRLVKVAVGALERAHESALLGPAVPFLVLLLHLHRVGLVVPDAGNRIDESRHSWLLLRRMAGEAGIYVGHYAIGGPRATRSGAPGAARSLLLQGGASGLGGTRTALGTSAQTLRGEHASASWRAWPCGRGEPRCAWPAWRPACRGAPELPRASGRLLWRPPAWRRRLPSSPPPWPAGRSNTPRRARACAASGCAGCTS